MGSQVASKAASQAVIEPDSLPLEGPRRRSSRGTLRTGLTLAEMEMEYIKAVLDRNKGHRNRTAKALGIDPKTLYNKLRAAKTGIGTEDA